MILGDPSRLRQIVMNLIGNAIKFTERGHITLSICRTSAGTVPGQLLISVQDSGIGIATNKQDKIFESFSQADSSTTRQYGGTGLGLAICKELAEMMQGTIDVQSELGVGSTFTVTLPLECEEPTDLGGDVIGKGTSIVGRRVAVIDRLLASRRAIEGSLRSIGAAVTSVADASELNAEFFKQGWDLVVFGCPDCDRWAMHCTEQNIPCLYLLPPHADVEMPRGEWSATLRKPAISSEVNAAAEGLIARDPRWRHLPRVDTVAANSSPLSDPATQLAVDSADATQPSAPARSSESLLSPIAKPNQQSGAAPIRVLVAEDGPINQDVIVGILQLRGYDVTVASDGNEAVKCVASDSFDICFMDVDMPKLDGIEATKMIREMASPGAPRLPIIAMTAHAGEQIWESCRSAGMDAYLPKPIHPDALFAAIEQLTLGSKSATPSIAVDVPSLLLRE
jgi:CheY-like chemotaxis protein/anti-sigma regulatory factor (Ser/Thr protein kinase)